MSIKSVNGVDATLPANASVGRNDPTRRLADTSTQKIMDTAKNFWSSLPFFSNAEDSKEMTNRVTKGHVPSELQKEQDRLLNEINKDLQTDVPIHQIANKVRLLFALMGGDAGSVDGQRINELLEEIKKLNEELVKTYKGPKALTHFGCTIAIAGAQVGIGLVGGVAGLFIPPAATFATTATTAFGALSPVTNAGKDVFITSEQTALTGTKAHQEALKEEAARGKENKNGIKDKVLRSIEEAIRMLHEARQGILR